MNRLPENDAEPAREYASPPCYAHELDSQPQCAPAPATAADITAALNALIEGERAGARGLIEMQVGCRDSALTGLMDAVARDEGRFCAMLTGHVVRLGGSPSRSTGVFFDKLMARKGLQERLAFLDRGQAAVVRILDELIPRIEDLELRQDLSEMRDVHVQNIERCAQFASPDHP